MQDHGPDQNRTLNRRGFLEAGAGALAVAATLGEAASAAQQDAPKPTGSAVLPKRTLGRTGVEVTILTQGTWKSAGGERLLRYSWANGIRYFDTAQSYGSEPLVARWLKAMPGARKGLFLVTKYHAVSSPRELLKNIDQRLAALQTDYIDLIFLHAVGDHNFANEVNWPSSKEFKETAEAIKKSGKAKFVGFSTHHPRRPEILQEAVKGGFVDAIMLQNDPWSAKEDSMNRALDACHKAGIGLISMKQMAGKINEAEVARRIPELKEKKQTPYQALLHAIWTDERFASCCVSMRNTDQVRDNAEAARTFKPMTTAEIRRLRDACIAAGPTMCASCDGRCSRAAGTTAELGNLTRFLTYHEHHGYRAEARRLYSEMDAAARDWQGADLEAARQACPNKLDFASLLPKADELLA
jgi:aryl-alcohol dehydrogenase-like predicted oxidoreductase